MENEAFAKWWKENRIHEYYSKNYIHTDQKAAYEAAQSASAARISELEAELINKADKIGELVNWKITRGLELQIENRKLLADCKAMAELCQIAHDKAMFRTCCCHMRDYPNPACLIAAKYKGAESTAREEGK